MRYAVYGKFNRKYFITSFTLEQRKFADNYFEQKVLNLKKQGDCSDFVVFAELNKDIILKKYEV